MTSSDADAALMLRVRNGDIDAFRGLVDRHQRTVINTIYRAIGDAWEAEDLAQRVFIQAYRSASRYRPDARFTTWLFTIVHNTIRNEYRRRHRHPHESLDAIIESNATGQSPHTPLPNHQSPNPAQAAMLRELQARLQAAIQNLPHQQRTAVILARFEGLSYDEIARVIGCSVSATKSLLHRARITLKEQLKEL